MLAQDKDKEPKRWECKDCGFISNRIKSIKYTWATFAICFKCRGSVKENPEWLAWLDRMRERTRPAMIAWMESRKAR